MKLGVVSLGCDKATVDSERLVGELVGHGAVVTPDLPRADVILVNTCGFIDAAKQESIDAILSAASLKAQGTVKAVVAVGCLVQRYKQELQQEIPEVDLFLGFSDLHHLVPALAERGLIEDPVARHPGVRQLVHHGSKNNYTAVYGRTRKWSGHHGSFRCVERWHRGHDKQLAESTFWRDTVAQRIGESRYRGGRSYFRGDGGSRDGAVSRNYDIDGDDYRGYTHGSRCRVLAGVWHRRLSVHRYGNQNQLGTFSHLCIARRKPPTLTHDLNASARHSLRKRHVPASPRGARFC